MLLSRGTAILIIDRTIGQGRIEHPRPPDISGVDDWNLGSLGLDFANFSLFYPILGLLIGKFCNFSTFVHPSLGLTK